MKRTALYLFLLIFSIISLNANEIRIWHAFEGIFEENFQEVVDSFNAQNRDYYISLENKGNYNATVDAGINAFYQGTPPHILMGAEFSTQTLMLKQDMFVPIEALFHKFQFALDAQKYIDIVREFYSNPEGKFQSLPWCCSVPVLFYNKKAFEKAGLNPEEPPKTWEEIERIAPLLMKKGYSVFTTTWPAAYHVEHYCTIHNIPFASHGNGIDSLSARLMFDVPQVEYHLSKLVEWKKKGIFVYGTQDNSFAENLFNSDKCAIILDGANRYPLIKNGANFSIGCGPYPYWSHAVETPSNLNIGGNSFWVFSGFSETEYLGIVKFLKYLSSTKVQVRWHHSTGYLPITHKACNTALNDQLLFGLQKAGKVAIESVTRQKPTTYTRGIRLGNYPRIRAILIGCLEQAISGKLTPAQALQRATNEGNAILEQFEMDFGSLKPIEPPEVIQEEREKETENHEPSDEPFIPVEQNDPTDPLIDPIETTLPLEEDEYEEEEPMGEPETSGVLTEETTAQTEPSDPVEIASPLEESEHVEEEPMGEPETPGVLTEEKTAQAEPNDPVEIASPLEESEHVEEEPNFEPGALTDNESESVIVLEEVIPENVSLLPHLNFN